MTYRELYESAYCGLVYDIITFDEFDKRTKPLDQEVDDWRLFEDNKLPPKGQHVQISLMGLVTMGWRSSEDGEELCVSIIDPCNYQIQHIRGNFELHRWNIKAWRPLSKAYEGSEYR